MTTFIILNAIARPKRSPQQPTLITTVTFRRILQTITPVAAMTTTIQTQLKSRLLLAIQTIITTMNSRTMITTITSTHHV
jgi:hypothetical protein